MLRGSESIRGGVPAHPLYHAKRAFLAHWCWHHVTLQAPPQDGKGLAALLVRRDKMSVGERAL
jgi:hypothetical protein